jgi:putative MFS transporter
MFIIAGIGSLIVWYLRKNLPESPRWLEAQGRTAEAETLMESIEKEVQATSGPLPAPRSAVATPQLTVASIFKPPILQRLLVGCWVLITINTLIFGFVIFLPQFFLRQGLSSAARSVRFCQITSGGAGALSAHRFSPSPPVGFIRISTPHPIR